MSGWFRRHAKRLLSRTYLTRNLLSSLAMRRDALRLPDSAVMTPRQKRQWLVQLVQTSGVRVFVETGTYYGDTLQQMSQLVTTCHSIEISDDLYARAVRRFRRADNVFLYHGNSRDVLPRVLAQLAEPAFFWLDAHFQDHINYDLASADRYFPIVAELESILSHPVRGHVVAIDDMRGFGRNTLCPAQEVVTNLLNASGLAGHWTLQNDILWFSTSRRTTPAAA